MRCGLLGGRLAHSYSPQIHKALANYSYQLFEKKPEELDRFLRSDSFDAINVTIPYKKDVIPYCPQLSDRAKQLGAVNTIVRQKDGTLIGHNTDFFGFSSMVLRTGLDITGKKALVLGSGGSSVTAVAVLKEMGASVVVISRSGEDNYTNLHRHRDAALIVNTTPVGMYPNNGTAPLDINLFPHLEGVLDIIYNPSRTQLLLDAEAKGIITDNGLWMLVAQAKESAEWFLCHSISDESIPQIHKKLRNQMENIILIGMPGCGKSTVGEILALKLNKTFIDADREIEKRAGMSIPDIFLQSGEDGFRAIESEVLRDLGKCSGLVIATGGGCVTRKENYPYLHQNGTIVWLQRDISQLPTDGRPLSQAGKLQQMYASRMPLYQMFADVTVSNDKTPESAADQIIQSL